MLKMFSTAHCTLCDVLFDKLLSLPQAQGLRIEVIDIANDAVLLERFGATIPVLQLGSKVLHTPFTDAELIEFLQAG